MKKYMYIATEDYDMVSVITASGAHILTDDKDEKAFNAVRTADDIKAEAVKLLEVVRDYGDPECWSNTISVDELDSMLDDCEIIAELEDEALIYQVCCWYGEDGADDQSFDTPEEAMARAVKLATESDYDARRPFKCYVEEMAYGNFGWGETEDCFDVVYAMPNEVEVEVDGGYHTAEIVTVLPQIGWEEDLGTVEDVSQFNYRIEDNFMGNDRFYDCYKVVYRDYNEEEVNTEFILIRNGFME